MHKARIKPFAALAALLSLMVAAPSAALAADVDRAALVSLRPQWDDGDVTDTGEVTMIDWIVGENASSYSIIYVQPDTGSAAAVGMAGMIYRTNFTEAVEQ